MSPASPASPVSPGQPSRWFLALMLGPELGRRLALPAAAALELPARGLRPVAPEDLHLTLCFAGPLSGVRAAELESALALALEEAPAPRLWLAGPSAFPAPGRERVLVVAVEERGGGEDLEELRERGLEAAGMACVPLPEGGRPFRPHVTLARVRAERSGRRPRVPERFYDQDFGIEWQPSSAAWVESGGGGGGYRVAAEFPLGAAGGS